MPTSIIKDNFFRETNFNNAIEIGTFPEPLKYADVKPFFKIDSRTAKKISTNQYSSQCIQNL